MERPGAQSGNHDNPYGAYTQDHQNWNNQAEQMRKNAQFDQDMARMRQEEENNRQQQAARQRQAEQNRQAQRSAQTQKKAKPTQRTARQTKPQAKPQTQDTSWSNLWALIGLIAGAAYAYSHSSGMEEPGWAIGFAAIFTGIIAGRFYKVIQFLIVLAVLLVIGAVAINIWGN